MDWSVVRGKSFSCPQNQEPAVRYTRAPAPSTSLKASSRGGCPYMSRVTTSGILAMPSMLDSGMDIRKRSAWWVLRVDWREGVRRPSHQTPSGQRKEGREKLRGAKE